MDKVELGPPAREPGTLGPEGLGGPASALGFKLLERPSREGPREEQAASMGQTRKLAQQEDINCPKPQS